MAYEGQQYGKGPFKPQANYYAPRPSAPRPSGRRSSRSPMIRQAIAQGILPDCYHSQRDSRKGGLTCMGKPSAATMTPEERHNFRVESARRNFSGAARAKGFCVRAQPDYLSRNGTRHGAIRPETLQRLGLSPAQCGRILAESPRGAAPRRRAPTGPRYQWE